MKHLKKFIIQEYYGVNGPIIVNSTHVPMLDLWLNAGQELGYTVGDPNGYQREGNHKAK